jgi:hypothetical protein
MLFKSILLAQIFVQPPDNSITPPLSLSNCSTYTRGLQRLS